MSDTNNLVPNDYNNRPDIFVKDLRSGDLEEVSVDADGLGIFLGRRRTRSRSPDGTRIAFDSDARNLGPDGNWYDRTQVVVKSLDSGALTLVSVDEKGALANEDAARPAWSPDGSRIAFDSWASRWLGRTCSHIYVANLDTGTKEVVSTDVNGVIHCEFGAGYGSWNPIWSPVGDQIAFNSYTSPLVPSDDNRVDDVLVKTLPGS